MWRRLKWRLIPITLGAALGCLILWDNAAHAATGDTGVFVPTVRSTIPDFTVTTGQPLHVNGYFYIPCTTYMGSTVPYSANFTVTPSVPGMGAIDPLTGQWDGIPTTSVASVTIKCTTPTGSAQDTFNINVQAGQTQLLATGKFVDCSAASNGTGTQASPWNRMSSVSGMTSGMDLWLKAGTSCNNQTFTMSTSGDADDYAVTGTYYLTGGVAYQLHPDNPTAFATDYTWSHGTRAKLRGTYNATCSKSLSNGAVSPSTCIMGISSTNAAAVPNRQYSPLFQINCDFCIVQSLALVESAGRCIQSGGTGNAVFLRHDVKILNNELGPCANDTLEVVATQHAVISGNYHHDGNSGGCPIGRGDCIKDSTTGTGAGRGAPTIGQFSNNAIDAFKYADILFEKNMISKQRGEGLIMSHIGHVIIRGNRWDGQAAFVALYAQDCDTCVYEYNVFYGRTPYPGGSTTEPSGRGIKMTAENAFVPGTSPNTDIIMRGNMFGATEFCFDLNSGSDTNGTNGGVALTFAPGSTYKYSYRVYNNTCIDPKNNGLVMGPNNWTPAQIGPNGIHIRNNIFWSEASVANPGGNWCDMTSAAGDANVSIDYNLWKVLPLANCRGAHDVVGNPLITGSNFPAKIDYVNVAKPSDFALQAGSAALNAGIPLTTTIINSGEFAASNNVAFPCAQFDTKGFVIDAVCRPVDTTPDLGAQGR